MLVYIVVHHSIGCAQRSVHRAAIDVAGADGLGGLLITCLPPLVFFISLLLRPVAHMKGRLMFLPRVGAV